MAFSSEDVGCIFCAVTDHQAAQLNVPEDGVRMSHSSSFISQTCHNRLEIHAIHIVETNFWLLQTVEYFLVKEVNYVVTDRSLNTSTGVGAGCGSVSGNTPKCTILSSTSTPLGGHYSESPATLDSPGDGLRGGRRSVSYFSALCFWDDFI